MVLGDAVEVLKELESEEYDAVFHDPPRYSLAGELYSREFYSELYRVLKRGGKLFTILVSQASTATLALSRVSRGGWRRRVLKRWCGLIRQRGLERANPFNH
jgi:predicted methyltransferase